MGLPGVAFGPDRGARAGHERLRFRPPPLDVLLALVFTGLTVATTVDQQAGTHGPPAYALAALTTAPIVLRQVAPVATTAVTLVAAAMYSVLGYGDLPGGGAGLLVGVFTVATLRSRRAAAAALVATIAVIAANYAGASSSIALPTLLQGFLLVLGACALGRATKRWGRHVERVVEEAATAVTDERARIARELHDIVAHHMSVISLQAGVAGYVLDTDPRTARAALDTVGDTSREALREMRRLLEVLRVDDEEPDAEDGARHGIAALDRLVDRVRAAGVPVEVAVTGRPRDLPPGLDLCAYRVVQESLTNVIKHAGPAAARVEVDYGDRVLTLRVRDDGLAAGPPRATPGSHGIRSMRERVELYGGSLTAGPARDGGFTVTASFPLSAPA
ncbi:sensor histidine kinase [Saccharothrix australiensis]|uniref:sensor histidine kinase n=1 Tax=Saccharothrix australiensis TaxID=2072 RepID=UPI001FEAA413|nr:sensor histidine kinase [Saccharothrix australiensis]